MKALMGNKLIQKQMGVRMRPHSQVNHLLCHHVSVHAVWTTLLINLVLKENNHISPSKENVQVQWNLIHGQFRVAGTNFTPGFLCVLPTIKYSVQVASLPHQGLLSMNQKWTSPFMSGGFSNWKNAKFREHEGSNSHKESKLIWN